VKGRSLRHAKRGSQTDAWGFNDVGAPASDLCGDAPDRVLARQVLRVDHAERDAERYPTTVEGSVRLIDSVLMV
jgi:hypothetical protein